MDLDILKNIPPWEWPGEADTMLLGVLADDRAKESDRLIAAELAGDYTVINDDLAKALLSIVRRGDETEEMRDTGAIALGAPLEHADTMGFDDDDEVVVSEGVFGDIQRTLREVFSDTDVPRNVRRMILEAAVRAPRDWHQEAIRTAYSSDEQAWRLTAVFCMSYVRGFEEQIREALDSQDTDIHYQAVCAAGRQEVDAAWSHVAHLVTADDTDKNLRMAAIEAAGSIRPRKAEEILGELADSDDEDIAAAASEALTMAGALSESDDDEDFC